VDTIEHPADDTRYRQRLVMYVVWHPKFRHGRALADLLYAHLNRPPAHPGSGGLGIPVLFRSEPPDGGTATDPTPGPVPFGEAHNTAVVLLVDDEFVAAPGWAEYAEQLWDAARAAGTTHRVYPVQLAEDAFNLSERIAAVNFIRPLGSPPAAIPPEGPPPAARTRLVNAVVHELCRLLLDKPRVDHASPAPAPLPPQEKLTIFLSHTKADGVPVAKAIKRHIEDETHLKTFFDANDIDYGEEFDPVLRREVQKGALLVVQTDAYASSVWCLEELLVAKAHRRPVLVVNAVAAGEERGPVYAGNVPTRRHDPGGYDQVVGRMLLEILRREHFMQHFEDLQKLFDLPPNVQPLPYPPEPLTLADLKLTGERATRFVYPDPPLGEGELSRLQILEPGITVTTPLLLLATKARSADRADPATTDSPGPTPPLEGFPVGLSVGNSPDLSRYGMGDLHLNEAAVAFARYLLACGADLIYGGTVELVKRPDGSPPPNFLDILLDLVRAHNKLTLGTSKPRVRLRNYIAEAFGGTVSTRFRARWKNVITIEIVPSDVARAEPASEAETRYYTARSLTAMRRQMTRTTRARVLLGGKSFGFEGKYPGLVEEAYLALEGPNPLPVYLVGAFGGAARAVIDALRGRDTPVLSRAWQEQAAPGYKAMAAVFDREAAAGRAEAIDYPALAEFFRSRGVAFLSKHNGLTEAENQRLFETPHVVEMVALVLRGLGRVCRSS
jgi:hypothetical protein